MRCFNGAVASQPRKDLHAAAVALMIELLQWGRGFAATEGSLAAAFGGVLPPLQWGRGFAATEGQDHLLGGVFGVLLQWGRGFAATEGRSSGVPQVDIPGFNGAVASQPRKGLKKGRKKPHNFCFNGAVASQPRKGLLPAASTAGVAACFNGAVASQPRKADTSHSRPCFRAVLQWGRGFAATEGR